MTSTNTATITDEINRAYALARVAAIRDLWKAGKLSASAAWEMTEATMADLESRTGSAPAGDVTEEAPGVFVAVLREPVAPGDLAEVAGSLPDDVVMTDADRDGDAVYTVWELPGSVKPFDWTPSGR